MMDSNYKYIWICELCDFQIRDTEPKYEYIIAQHPHQLVKCKNLNYNEKLNLREDAQ